MAMWYVIWENIETSSARAATWVSSLRSILIKNNNGEIYFPEFNFNGLGDLVYSRGYQSYLTEEVFNFSICPTLVVEWLFYHELEKKEPAK